MKCLEKKWNGNCIRMVLAVLNRSWKQHPRKQHMYSHFVSISLTIYVRWARHPGHCWKSDELMISSYIWTHLCWLANKNLQPSVQFRHWMLHWGLGDSLGYLCCHHCLMIMLIMMVTFTILFQSFASFYLIVMHSEITSSSTLPNPLKRFGTCWDFIMAESGLSTRLQLIYQHLVREGWAENHNS